MRGGNGRMLAALLLVVLMLAQVALADFHAREARALPDQRRSRSIFVKYRRQDGEFIIKHPESICNTTDALIVVGCE